MINRVFNYVKSWFVLRPTHNNIEQNSDEHYTISKKRPGDFINYNFPSKRICLETPIPGPDRHPRQALPLDADNFLSPDLRKLHHVQMPRINKHSTTFGIAKSMDSKNCGASCCSSSLCSHHGKENVIEISDEDNDICQAAHTHPAMKTRDDRSCWVTAQPKYDPTSKSFQRSHYKEENKTVNDNFSRASKSPDFTPGRCQWPVLESTTSKSTSVSRQLNRIARGRPLVNRPKRLDNRMYTPLMPSAARVIQESYRLVDKDKYSQILQQYMDRKTLSTRFPTCPTTTMFNGVFDKKRNLLVSYTKTKSRVEFIDLTRIKEQVPTVRKDQESKPQTLASKLADKPAEFASTSRSEALKSPVNSFEELLKHHTCSQPRYLDDLLMRFEERKQDAQKSLKEPQLRAEQYAQQNDEKHIERVFRHIALTDSEIVLEEVLEEEVPQLPTLQPRMEAAIDAALKPHPPHETLVDLFSLRITRRDMYTLANLNWLNDEVINFYMNLLIERGKRDTFLSVYAFNTFFYGKLVTPGGFVTLKRWTRKIDIFSYDIIIVPVHLGVHWCMAAIDFRDKTIRYYDSMGAQNNRCLNALSQYLEDESMDKKKKPYDTTSWKKINVKDNPQQMNGSDCGVFACIYSEYICRDAKITFTQADMPYFRRKMVFEILSGKLMDFI